MPPDWAADAAISLPGLTLLPGLFNVHVHLGVRLPPLTRRQDPYSPGFRTLLNYRRALEALHGGATTLRAIGDPYYSDIDVRDAINRGLLPGPRLVVSGHALTPLGGHGCQNVSCLEANGADGFRQAAREQLRAGADFLKLCLTNGVPAPDHEPVIDASAAEIEAAVDVARAAGKMVAAHVGGSRAILEALRLGVRSIEHGFSFDRSAAAAMADAGAFLVPTLCYTLETAYMRQVGAPEAFTSHLDRVAERHLESTRLAIDSGVTVCSGTDILPSDQVSGTVATIREIEHLVTAGLRPLHAIQAATLNSARLCGVEQVTGTLQTGKAADVIAVAGRPDEDIAALREVRLVVRGGQVVRSDIPAIQPGSAALAGGLAARF